MIELRGNAKGGHTVSVVRDSRVSGEIGRWPIGLGFVLVVETILAVFLQPGAYLAETVRLLAQGIKPNLAEVVQGQQQIRRVLAYMLLSLELRIRKELHGGNWAQVPEWELSSAFQHAQKLEKTWWWMPNCIFGMLHVLIPACGPAVIDTIKEAARQHVTGCRWKAPGSLEALMREVDNLPVKESLLKGLRN